MTTRTWHVYTLLDPRSREVRYVGITQDTRTRLRNHTNEAKRGKDQSYRSRWIRLLLKVGLKPLMVVVETGTGDWAKAEKHWIAHFRRIGCKLVNTVDGGRGTLGRKVSDESRAKVAATLKGHPVLPETRAKLSVILRGRKQPPGTLAKIRAAASRRIGIERAPETRAKISAAKMGHVGCYHSLEWRKR